MTQSTLARKMKLKPDARATIINAPEGYLEELQHDGEVSENLKGKFDWIQLFAKNKTELASFAPRSAFAFRPYKEGEARQSVQLGE